LEQKLLVRPPLEWRDGIRTAARTARDGNHPEAAAVVAAVEAAEEEG
jgi:hypothetical protein